MVSIIITLYNKQNTIDRAIQSALKQSYSNCEVIVVDDSSIYQIALIHEPDMINKIKEKLPTTSLILAGHSINGSINIPGIKNTLLPEGAKNYYNPYYELDNTRIYISNGIGVNNVNFRLFNTPSFNLYRLNKKTS